MRLALILSTLAAPALADLPVVEAVEARPGPSGWTVSVTVSHPDTGWDHYADAWALFAPDGTELARRVLHHPHVEEQPFTRSQSGIALPDGLTEVIVRAHDSVHGWGAGVTLTLP
jgi:hypothetical protein